MGKLLQESIKRVEQNLNPGSLRMCIFLGKIGGLKDNSQLQIHLIPRYKSQGHEAEEIIPIPPEVLEVAEGLRKRIAEEKSEDDKTKKGFLGDGADSDTKEVSKSPTDNNNRKSGIKEGEIMTRADMDVDFLLESEIKNASEEQLINLKKWIEAELAIRKKQVQIEVPSKK
jgi:hypothetical protein